MVGTCISTVYKKFYSHPSIIHIFSNKVWTHCLKYSHNLLYFHSTFVYLFLPTCKEDLSVKKSQWVQSYKEDFKGSNKSMIFLIWFCSQWFPNVTLLMNFLGNLVKCRFWALALSHVARWWLPLLATPPQQPLQPLSLPQNPELLLHPREQLTRWG